MTYFSKEHFLNFRFSKQKCSAKTQGRSGWVFAEIEFFANTINTVNWLDFSERFLYTVNLHICLACQFSKSQYLLLTFKANRVIILKRNKQMYATLQRKEKKPWVRKRNIISRAFQASSETMLRNILSSTKTT